MYPKLFSKAENYLELVMGIPAFPPGVLLGFQARATMPHLYC